MTTSTQTATRGLDVTASTVRSQRPRVEHESIESQYRRVRACTEYLCEPLQTEDFVVQNAPEISPTKWHLAHTSWFLETFVLSRWFKDYEPLNPEYRVLFNSYYDAVGSQFPKAHRGTLSRPTVQEVMAYRKHVDEHLSELLRDAPSENQRELAGLVTLGIHHEQQHQELILTDIKHVLGAGPMAPPYRHDLRVDARRSAPPLSWHSFEEGIRWIGHDDAEVFAYDNEGPRHRVFLEPFELANRLVTNGEYLEFMNAGGYDRPEYWLADGWQKKNDRDWQAPLYWIKRGDTWFQYTLGGVKPVDEHEPVCHVSSYEAHAYARWAGARLPTEFEWEAGCPREVSTGNLVEQDRLHPAVADPDGGFEQPHQMLGDVWEWTSSAYLPYPGFSASLTAIGEYNGKFMCNQMVLRGGSCVTPRSHVRRTYRNFFAPDARWQFTGFRLARTP